MARKDSATKTITVPNKRIPVVIAGEQKYVETKDLVLTGDEKQELKSNQRDAQWQANVKALVLKIYENAASFTMETVASIAPKGVLAGGDVVFAEWLNTQGVEVVQDGLTTVVRAKVEGNMKVIRSMTATVEPRFSDDVAMWIRKEVTGGVALGIASNASNQ